MGVNRTARNANLDVLSQILSETKHTLRTLREPAQLLAAFRSREVSATAWFTGNLNIGGSLDIAVKVSRPELGGSLQYPGFNIGARELHCFHYDHHFNPLNMQQLSKSELSLMQSPSCVTPMVVYKLGNKWDYGVFAPRVCTVWWPQVHVEEALDYLT